MMLFKKPWFIALLLALSLIAGISSALFNKNETKKSPSIGGDFTLQSVTGDVSLSDFEGKLVLLFFGYTHCPDVCPLTLANVKVALKQLPETQRKQVQTLFVSVDPDRDTLEHLNEYVHYFDPSFIGLTSTKEQLDKVVRQYGAFYRFVELPDSALAYTVDHSSRMYLMDQQGNVVKFLYHDSSSTEISDALKGFL